MNLRISRSICAAWCFGVVLAACAGGSSRASDLTDPGSWAYEGCKQGVLERIKRDHPQVQAIELDSHISETKDTDRKSTLVGEGKFPKDNDNFHFKFKCEVDRDNKSILEVKYDKQ